jgi:ribosomal protein L37AE/L43A
MNQQRKQPPPTSFTLISPQIRQCRKCNKFIKGSITHLANHLKTHNNIRRKYQCPNCKKLYSRKDFLILHGKTIHNITIQEFIKIKVLPPPIETIKTWNKPFESTPKIKITPAKRPDYSIDNYLQQMITLPRPISPIQDPTHLPEPDLLASTSTETICQDERKTLHNTDIFIYSVYNVFS